ncbi:unnamed protein product [Urochloa humidicola]
MPKKEKKKKRGSPAGDALGAPALLHGCRCRGRPPQGMRPSSHVPATRDALVVGHALPSRAPAAGNEHTARDVLPSRALAAGDSPPVRLRRGRAPLPCAAGDAPTLPCGGRCQGTRLLVRPPPGRPAESRG